MSYILEALEKSENERKQRAVPDLQTQHTVHPGLPRSRSASRLRKATRRIRPAVLVAVLIMAAAWLFREYIPVALEIKITREPAPRSDFTGNTDNTALSIPVIQQGQPQLSRKETVNKETEITAGETTPPTAQQQLTTGDEATDESSSAATEQAEESVVRSAAPAADSAKQTVIARNSITLQPAPIILADNNSTEPPSTTPALPFFEELPASVKNDLPKLKFAGHTFSAIPQDRLIIINSGIKREGDSVATDLRLEEITWEGVILNFRGLRFQIITTSL